MRHKAGTLTNFCKWESYLVETYGNDDMIAETDEKVMRFTQSPNKTMI